VSAAPNTAALAGVPAGLQSHGIWVGHRQVFVRFATEAETATMYTSTALARELTRQSTRPGFHSICISGRDPLGSDEFLANTFGQTSTSLPIMVDTDGQRPGAITTLSKLLAIVQFVLDFREGDAAVERGLESLSAAAAAGVAGALVLEPHEETSDPEVLRVVEQLHQACEPTSVVLHPTIAAERAPTLDRRWATLMEQAVALHADTRLLLRIPPPAGMR
jgi:hypothetical protein